MQVLAQLDDTLAQIEYIEAQQALEELYSAASIATAQAALPADGENMIPSALIEFLKQKVGS
jgi:hypothetical protein